MGLTIKSDEKDKGTKVIRKDRETKSGGTFATYSLMVSSKDADGNWQNGFIDCKFKKGVEVENKAKIKVNNAFYVVEKYGDRNYTKLMITDFDVLEGGESASPTTDADGFMVIDETDDEFVMFK